MKKCPIQAHTTILGFQKASEAKRQIGIVSAAFLIFNRVIGTGIFATPGAILALSGSVGLSLFMWVAGMLIAAAGTLVYVEIGTGIPRNGGEKNLLEFVYRKPKFLTTCLYTGYVVLLGWAAGNSVVFGEYILQSARVEVTEWRQRGLGVGCVSFAFLVHSTYLKWGLRLQNFLGVLKFVIILIIIIAPLCNLKDTTNNFTNAFEGTTGSAYGIVTSLYNVIWSYVGYSNANYALSETKNPTRTLKIAAPLAIGTVAILYMLVNISYFAGVSKEEILTSQRLVAASLFRNMYGPTAERALCVFVALSALGNIMSVIFSQGRLVQELGREGILPFSSFWASNRPFNAPMPGLFWHWLITVITILAPPAGDAYNFVLKYVPIIRESLLRPLLTCNPSLISYPLAIINAFVAAGVIYLYFNRVKRNWYPPVSATLPVVIFFFLSNVYLIAAPFSPPDEGQNIYKDLPYYIHCVVGFGVILAGGVYWFIFTKVLPKIFGYELIQAEVVDEIDGWPRNVFKRVPKGSANTTAETTF